MEDKLKSREFANRRFMLEALGTKAMITAEGIIEIELPLGDRMVRRYGYYYQ
jgi:hypothetical protein